MVSNQILEFIYLMTNHTLDIYGVYCVCIFDTTKAPSPF
jgi:hypothetical protein